MLYTCHIRYCVCFVQFKSIQSASGAMVNTLYYVGIFKKVYSFAPKCEDSAVYSVSSFSESLCLMGIFGNSGVILGKTMYF